MPAYTLSVPMNLRFRRAKIIEENHDGRTYCCAAIAVGPRIIVILNSLPPKLPPGKQNFTILHVLK